MLKGEAKKTYQRNYMRTYTRNKRASIKQSSANSHVVKTPLRPIEYDADGYPIYDP